MTFFFDNNLSPKLAKAINELDEVYPIIHLRDIFPADTEDEIWLRHVGNNNMVLVSRDTKIRKHPAEINAIRKHRIGAFFLIGKKYTKWQGIRQLICAWEEIRTLVSETTKPFVFQVSLRGKITRISL